MCTTCESVENLKYCKLCKAVRYCSEECHIEDWPRHRLVCLRRTSLVAGTKIISSKKILNDMSIIMHELHTYRADLDRELRFNKKRSEGERVTAILYSFTIKQAEVVINTSDPQIKKAKISELPVHRIKSGSKECLTIYIAMIIEEGVEIDPDICVEGDYVGVIVGRIVTTPTKFIRARKEM